MTQSDNDQSSGWTTAAAVAETDLTGPFAAFVPPSTPHPLALAHEEDAAAVDIHCSPDVQQYASQFTRALANQHG